MIILYTLGAIITLLLTWRLALAIYCYTVKRLLEVKGWRLDLQQRTQTMSEPRTVYPDATGTFPLLLPARSDHVLDPGRSLLWTLFDGLIAASPEVARPEQIRRMLQGAGGWPGGSQDPAGLLAGPANANLPREIPLRSVVSEPDIRDLVLGVTIRDDGQMETVKADMAKLVHVAVGGSSGWGKSVFLRSLGYQLAMSKSPVDLAMVDPEGATLSVFARCGRLMFPIAETEKDALAIFQALQDELERRKDLYSQYPGVDSLEAYNAIADEKLNPVVAIVDEATALLGDKSVESALRTLALRSRKYGVWLILAGQDWKASSLDTAIRNQLSTRVQFRAMSKSQSRVLLEQSGAEELTPEGRALTILPGQAMFTMQAPFVSARTIMADVSNGGPREPMPQATTANLDSTTAQRIKDLADEGLGICAIADEVFGYHNSAKTAIVKDVLGLD